MAERDELELLRALWRDVRPPTTGDALDPETGRAVDWMRAAWRQVEAPVLPLALQRAPRRASGAAVALGVLAAAASVLLAMRLLNGSGARDDGWTAVSRSDPDGVAGDVEEHPDARVAAGDAEEASPLVAIAPDRIEMRRGSVHLILLRQDEAAGGPSSGEPR